MLTLLPVLYSPLLSLRGDESKILILDVALRALVFLNQVILAGG